MKIVKIALGVIVALIVVAVATAVVARSSDGPIGIFPGGPLVAGEEVDFFIVGWGLIERRAETIEMQLIGEDTSRTTWFVEHVGRGYIPASTSFPPGKTWHTRADGKEAWLRVDDKRYHVRLDRIDDAEVMDVLAEKVEAKYGGVPGDDTWWFKVHSLAPIPSANF